MVNYMEIFEVLPQPCLLISLVEGKTRIDKANKAFCHITGLRIKSAEGIELNKFCSEFNIQPSCLEKIENSLESCFESQEAVTLEPIKYSFQKVPNLDNFGNYWSMKHIPVNCGKSLDEHFVLTILTDITSQLAKEKENVRILKELDRSVDKCHHFIDKNSDGLFSLDENGNFQSVNEGLLQIAEISEEELLKMSFLPFCENYHREMVLEYFQKALKDEKQEFQADFVSAKGRKVIMDVFLVPLKIRGKIKGVYGIAKDVTERLRAEEKARQSEENLRRSESKFKALVQEGSDMISIINREGIYEFVSDSVSNILGKQPEDYLGRSAFDFMHPHDKERVYTNFLELLESRQIEVLPFRIKNVEEEWCWIESKATNLLEDPNVGGIVVNSKDVTESFLQKNKIEELNERYRLASCATEDLIYDWDLVEDHIVRNRAFEENYGFGPKESLTPEKVWFTRIYKGDHERIISSFNSAMKDTTRKKWTEEYRFLKKNGKLAYLVDRAYILRNADGEAIRVVGAVTDVTQSQEALNKIGKQNTLLKEIAWEQAHVIRAPLARLKALVDTLEDSTFQSWTREELIGYIKSSANELDEILLKRIQKIESINV